MPIERSHVYGPVPSRRLGFSLGVDIIPPKTCTFDCIYCQLGCAPNLTTQRKNYFSTRKILAQIKAVLDSGEQVDHITFSGSGEPTLNASLGKIIREIKKITAIPVAVLTNSSLLGRKEVRKELLIADVIVPSLDAATAQKFASVNRPPSSFRLGNIIRGLVRLRREFHGKIWLEVLLVKGVNDSPEDIQALKKAIERINPDEVHLNTVVRPPAESFALPLTRLKLETVRRELGDKAKVVAGFRKRRKRMGKDNLEEAVLAVVRRRSVTVGDISGSLGEAGGKIRQSLVSLEQKGKIRSIRHRKKAYYELVPGT